ncbi:MAG: hypothetical protein WDO06_03860 [Actinomycetota bacterium]
MISTTKRNTVRALLVFAIGAALLAPLSASAQTKVVGGPLTNLDPAGGKIHLAFSNFPTTPANVGLYVLECLNNVVAGKTGASCDSAHQLWVSNSPGASATPNGDIAITVVGTVAGTECGTSNCSIFITFDHTNPADRSEDQLIPISFAAGTSAPVLPKDVITATVEGKTLSPSSPGSLAYRTPTFISASAQSGSTVTFGSSTPDCTVAAGVLTALKGTGACDITVSVAATEKTQATTAHYPFLLSPGVQTIKTPKKTLKVGKTFLLSSFSNFGEKVVATNATPKICSIKGSVLKGLKKGTCTIALSAAGQTDLWAAIKVKTSIKVS